MKNYKNNLEALQDLDDSIEFLQLKTHQNWARANGKSYPGAEFTKRPKRKIDGKPYIVNNDPTND
jgi:hypothetical protein